MQKTLIIGDIHGCYIKLQALLDKAGLGAGDGWKIFFELA